MTLEIDTTQHTGLGVEERGVVRDRPVDRSEGSVGSSSPRYSPIADSVSKIDELIETVETVEIVDGVRARLAAGPSVIETETVSDSIVDGGEGVAACVVGVAPLVGVERCVGVGVMEVVGEEGDDGVSEGSGAERGDVRGVKTSLRGVGLVNKLAEGCETLGRMKDVSKLISGPSGIPLDIVLEGARMDDSKDASVSSAH